MRLEIERGELLKALSHVTSVVERRTTIPILSNVMLKASGDTLMFKATDLEREVSESVAAKVTTPGTLTVPAHVLHDIVRKLPEGAEIEMKRDGDKERLTITSGHSRFSLQTLSAEDFPGSDRRRDRPRIHDGGRRPEAAHRQDAVCDLDGRDALLSQRHLSAPGRDRKDEDLARGRDRRASLSAGRAAASERRGGNAGRHRAAKDRARAGAPSRGYERQGQGRRVADEGALRDRARRADVEADRRHVPGLRARHSAQQRQGNEGAERVVQERGRSRLDDRQRARPRGQAQRRRKTS